MQATARSARIAFAIVSVSLAFLALGASPAMAAPDCAVAVIDDWAQGTLESAYPLECYDAAIDALPEDLRAYTTAANDISRAATTANRTDAPTRELASTPVTTTSASSFPVTVALLGAFVILLSASGVAASVVRRRRGR